MYQQKASFKKARHKSEGIVPTTSASLQLLIRSENKIDILQVWRSGVQVTFAFPSFLMAKSVFCRVCPCADTARMSGSFQSLFDRSSNFSPLVEEEKGPEQKDPDVRSQMQPYIQSK